MKAILLAAGEGTRLRPLTETIPKCLVPINGVPLLDIWLEQLIVNGVDRVLINTSYLADQVKAHIAQSPYRAHVTLVHEPELMGTAGTLMNNRFWTEGETFVMAHADNLLSCDWQAFFEAHNGRPANTILTMMTFETETPEACGIVELAQNGTIAAYHEKVSHPPGNLANAAVFVIEPALINELLAWQDAPYDFCVEVLPRLYQKTFTWHNDCFLMDIGTPESYALAQKRWRVLGGNLDCKTDGAPNKHHGHASVSSNLIS